MLMLRTANGNANRIGKGEAERRKKNFEGTDEAEGQTKNLQK